MRTHFPSIVLGYRLVQTSLAMGLMLGLGTTSSASPANFPIHIELRAHVETTSTQITLADVARITGNNSLREQRLRTLVIGRAPRAGDAIQLGRNTLTQWIRSRGGVEAKELSWSGAQVVNIRSATTQLLGNQVAQCAQDSVAEAVHRMGLRGEFRLLRTPPDFVIPRGNLELQARPQSELSSFRGVTPAKGPILAPRKRQSIWVDVWVNDQFIRTIPVAFEISLYAPAFVAVRPLVVGETLRPAQLRVEEVDLTQHRDLPLLAPTSIEVPGAAQTHADAASTDTTVSKPVEPGAVINASNTKLIPLVSQGGFAILHSNQGPIQLESRVEVLQDGAMGQAVRVRIPNAASSILAYVTGRNQVEVRP